MQVCAEQQGLTLDRLERLSKHLLGSICLNKGFYATLYRMYYYKINKNEAVLNFAQPTGHIDPSMSQKYCRLENK